MNFYKHHIGDYAQATAHLSFAEDAAYSRLIRKYYADEKPLPADVKAVQRLVGARSKEEKEAVVTVLEEFFYIEADGWHNKRCDEELSKWQAQAETNRRIAEEREARRRVSKSVNDNGTNRAERSHESLHETNNESLQKREPNQNPESRIQNKPLASGEVNLTPGTPAGSVCARLRESGIADVNPQHPRLLALLAAGLTVDEIAAVGPEAKLKGKGFAWILAAAEGRRRDAAQVAELPVKPEKPWYITASGIEQKGGELGLKVDPATGGFPGFRVKVLEASGITEDMLRTARQDFGVGG